MSEPQFVDGKVVGQLDNGIFFQRITQRHIYRVLNAKGMDFYLHRSLKGKCHKWLLEFEDTSQRLEILFPLIEKVGIKRELPRAGMQYLVKLKEFDVVRPVMQVRMIGLFT